MVEGSIPLLATGLVLLSLSQNPLGGQDGADVCVASNTIEFDPLISLDDESWWTSSVVSATLLPMMGSVGEDTLESLLTSATDVDESFADVLVNLVVWPAVMSYWATVVSSAAVRSSVTVGDDPIHDIWTDSYVESKFSNFVVSVVAASVWLFCEDAGVSSVLL